MNLGSPVLPSRPGSRPADVITPSGLHPWSPGSSHPPDVVALATISRVSAGTGTTAAGRSGAPATSMLDRRLAARLAAGDPDALAQVYEEFGRLVLGVARRVLRDDRLAEDVTQEVFAFLWEHPERYDPARGTLRAWLGLLAHRRSVDRVRAESRRNRTEARIDPSDDMECGADERFVREWACSRVRRALDTLPNEQREVLVLAYFGGHSYRDVAVSLAIPEGTVKSRIRLALRRLNEILRAELAEEGTPAWT